MSNDGSRGLEELSCCFSGAADLTIYDLNLQVLVRPIVTLPPIVVGDVGLAHCGQKQGCHPVCALIHDLFYALYLTFNYKI